MHDALVQGKRFKFVDRSERLQVDRHDPDKEGEYEKRDLLKEHFQGEPAVMKIIDQQQDQGKRNGHGF